jgi:hypothetical protein
METNYLDQFQPAVKFLLFADPNAPNPTDIIVAQTQSHKGHNLILFLLIPLLIGACNN